MKFLLKVGTSIFRKNSYNLSENLFGAVEKITKTQSREVTTLKPYIRKAKSNSVFATLGTKTSSAVNLGNVKYKKAKTLEEAQEFAQRSLGIKSFDIPDLDIANQVNLSITDAIKRTKGKIQLPDKVEFTSITGDFAHKKYLSIDCPAETEFNTATNEMVLRINKDFYNNIDNKINSYITHFEKNGQLSKNVDGLSCIDLIAPYHYDATLNRYYRLYKQGKLTQKAKIDFENLLQNARREEMAILNTKEALTDTVMNKLGIDLKSISHEEYIERATQALLKLRKEQNVLFSNNYYQTQKAIGLDGDVKHELGHITHFRNVHPENCTDEIGAQFDNISDFQTALHISPYATNSKGEAFAEWIKGILSGDKYSDEVNRLCEKIYGRTVDLF